MSRTKRWLKRVFGMGTLSPVSADEFERRYAERSGISIKQLRSFGRIVCPCRCGELGCEGWISISREAYEEDLKAGLAKEDP